MDNLLLLLAGIGGIVVGGVHGYLGQTQVLARMRSDIPAITALNGAVFHLSTFYWTLGGVALLWAAYVEDMGVRQTIAIGVAVIYAAGAVANFTITRGRHFGWMLLAALTVMALLGGG
jgi:hypothetical protein|tara:strand:+ start:7478 stop:7831 length:354 start_codon:yes stop_codon:yes gene_type:complete